MTENNLIHGTFEDWMKIASDEKYQFEYLNSGVAAINNMGGGYPTKMLTILAGGTGSGKSLVSLSSACLMADNGYKVLYISYENGYFLDNKRAKNIKNIYNIESKNFENIWYIDANAEENGFGLADIKEKLNNGNYDVVFIDSIDLIKESQIKDGDNSFYILDRVANELRHIAERFNCAMVATSQLNRKSMTRQLCELMVDDIQGSLGVAQKAAAVWMIRGQDNWGIKRVKFRDELPITRDIGYMSTDGTLNIEYDIVKAF